MCHSPFTLPNHLTTVLGRLVIISLGKLRVSEVKKLFSGYTAGHHVGFDPGLLSPTCALPRSDVGFKMHTLAVRYKHSGRELWMHG